MGPDEFNNILVSPIRLPLLAVIAMYEEVDFTFLKNELQLSDGNLGANLRKLEDADFILCKKKFLGRKPKSLYRLTKNGRIKLLEFIQTMTAIGDRLSS